MDAKFIPLRDFCAEPVYIFLKFFNFKNKRNQKMLGGGVIVIGLHFIMLFLLKIYSKLGMSLSEARTENQMCRNSLFVLKIIYLTCIKNSKTKHGFPTRTFLSASLTQSPA